MLYTFFIEGGDMEKLWAPWRMKYILHIKSKKCFLCRDAKNKKRDSENYVLLRGRFCFVVLNAFPYSNGHLMVAPYRHTGKMENLKEEEIKELMEMGIRVMGILKKALKPDGFNMGINLGKVSGAGLADHIHLHVVPRWQGDTNFMPILGNAKVISQSLNDTYRILKRYLKGSGDN
jgi:ATP adenylyltransferase